MAATRSCLKCGAFITACFGSVLARDAVLAMDGKIPYTRVREHCGRCVTRIVLLDMNNPGTANAYLLTIPDLEECEV